MRVRASQPLMRGNACTGLVRSPAYIASLVAALLALVPAIIRLYESIAGNLAAPSLYLAWLLLWIVTASGLLWTGFGKTGPRLTRIAIAVCGGGMLFAMVMTVTAVSGPATSAPAALATLGHVAVAGGAGTCVWQERRRNRLAPISWAVAAFGAFSLALASIFFLVPNQPWFGLMFANGTFLLGTGLSLALGQYGETTPPPVATAAASQEP